MKERPILFSAPMVRALLDGSKTQTRRIEKRLDPKDGAVTTSMYGNPMGACWAYGGPVLNCPYGQPGDRLWVRETSRAEELPSGLDGVRYLADDEFHAIENTQEASEAWSVMYHYRGQRGATVPGIHMPRWASRILLEIVSVRVERLQDISYEDALAEGAYDPAKCPLFPHTDKETPEQYARRTKFPQRWYSTLWEEINGVGSWAANPWVWVVEFKKIESSSLPTASTL